ncbi:MAG: cupin domain-containing protein [Woeseiaceae bacterium]|nr:cupin domain-containing protein [Woeseiaceae bacterium]
MEKFNPENQTVAIGRALDAQTQPAVQDPAIPVDGYTFGVATMTENSPHDGEMHPDGDEVLYLISGRVGVRLETDPVQELEMDPGDGLIVPKGVWHRVDILEPSQIVYLTPGPNGEYRPLPETK